MKYIKSIICAVVIMTTVHSFAQQDPNYTFYRYNMNLINPAYAGAEDGLEGSDIVRQSELGLNVRSQWASVEGAPETQSAFFSTGVGNNVGLGVSIINDQTFVENQTSISIDFSYRLKVSDRANLFLGIKAGANSYSVNTDGLTTFDIDADPSLVNLDGGFTPNVGVGAYLKGEKYFVSFSAPKLLTPDRLEQDSGIASLGVERVHVYFSTGYDFKLGERTYFKPSTMVRYVDASPLSIDVTAAFEFANRFELAPVYRVDEALGGYFIFRATKHFDFGYAYQNGTSSPVSAAANGSHEIFMKIRM